MKKNYTLTLDTDTWTELEAIARQRNFVYHGRLSRGMVIEAFVDAYRKKRAGGAVVESPPTEASARDVEKRPVWTMAAVMAHWPEKDAKRYKLDEGKYKYFAQLILDTINEQSP